MHICSLGKIDWVKNFLNFHNSGRQTKLKSMTSNSHSPMDDLESEDNTTANPNELDLANCEGENANRNRQGGAAKKKATDNESGYLHVYSFRDRSDWLHLLNFGRHGLGFVLKLGVINFVSNTSTRAINDNFIATQ